MDLEKHLIEVKTLVSENQQLREEISRYNLELVTEEQWLDISKMHHDKVDAEIEHLTLLREYKRSQLESIKADGARLNKLELQKTLLTTCLNKMPPVAGQQVDRFKALQAEYQKLLGLYEQQPLYQELMQESVQQRALEERIKKYEEEIEKEETVSEDVTL